MVNQARGWVAQGIAAPRAIAWAIEANSTRYLDTALEYELVIQLERAIYGRFADLCAERIARPTLAKPVAQARIPLCTLATMPVLSSNAVWATRARAHVGRVHSRGAGIPRPDTPTPYLGAKLIKRRHWANTDANREAFERKGWKLTTAVRTRRK